MPERLDKAGVSARAAVNTAPGGVDGEERPRADPCPPVELDTYEGPRRRAQDEAERQYHLFGPSSEERLNMGDRG